MEILKLQKIPHDVKIGDNCASFEPTITRDTLFVDADTDQPVGFYMRQMPEKMCTLADIANSELLSERVPKSEMRRLSGLMDASTDVRQFSTIIGSVPPKPAMRRNYATISSVHGVASAQGFIRAMCALCEAGERLVEQIIPGVAANQRSLISDNVPEKYRFGTMFTSSISNFNISAPFHIDKGNIEHCVNLIITKRHRATGGNLHLPDYGATIDSDNNSVLVYPAWRNIHGVTPIVKTGLGGYRNSLIFYPLKLFKKYMGMENA